MTRPVLGVKLRVLALAIAIACASVPLHRFSAGATAVPVPSISAGFHGTSLTGFDIAVSGQYFTPFGRADVLILEQGRVRQHDVVVITAQGTFTDDTTLACDFHANAITAYDRHSGQWSNQAVIGGVCPG
jgi:hypothetical protein